MGSQEKNIPWYLSVLRAYSQKTIVSTGIILIALLIGATIQLSNGTVFEWKNIEPIEQPDLMSRLVYSALVFVSLGAILYWLHFYKLLSMIFGSDRRGYREAKRLVWTGLILVMYFYIVPTVVNLLNSSISFAYNIALLILYLSPVLFVITIITLTAVAIATCRVKSKYVHASEGSAVL